MALLTLSEVKAHLHIADAVTTYDTKLQGYVDSVEVLIERHIGGPVITRSITETVEPAGYCQALVLTYRPVVSLTGITADGVAVDTSDVYVSAGRVLRRQFRRPFLLGFRRPVEVTYTAGLGATAPAAVKLAAEIIIANLWEPQRGSAGAPGPNDDFSSNSTWTPGFGFAVPNRALELLNPYAPETGIA